MKDTKNKQKKRFSIKQQQKRRSTIVNPNEKNLVFSESICRIIIDKIIALAIRNSNRNSIYSKINNYCFDFANEKINFLLSSNFLKHENNKNNDEQNNFFSNIPDNMSNTWVELNEPNVPEIGRDHISKMKIIKSNIQEINEVNNENNNLTNEKRISESKRRRRTKNYNIIKKFILDNIEKQINQPKSKRIPIMDMEYTDIPKEDFINIYSEKSDDLKNKYLQFEKEKELLNKELQEKNEAMSEYLIEKLKQKIFGVRVQREIDVRRLTFDSNGNILYKKIPNINFFPNEFKFLYSKYGDSKTRSQSTNLFENEISKKKNYNLKKGNNENNNIIIKENNENNNNNIIKEKNENIINNINNDEIQSKNIKTEGDIKLKNASKKLNVITKFKLKPITNPNEVIEYNPLNSTKITFSNLKDIVPISGSNFNLIIPSTGVRIQTEGEKEIKEGGFDYYEKYKRPSMNDFNQLSMKATKLNKELYSSNLNTSNLTQNKSISNLMKNNLSEENLSYIGYNKQFKDNNPLIYDSTKFLINNNSNNNIIKKNDNNKYLIKNRSQSEFLSNKISDLYRSFDDIKKRKKNNNLNENIKLTNKELGINLYSFLSSPDKESSDKEQKNKLNNTNNNNNLYSSNDNIKKSKVNIFPQKQNLFSLTNLSILPKINEQKNMKNNIDFYGKNDINKLNEKILNSKLWGNINFDLTFNERQGNQIPNFFRKPKKNNKIKDLKTRIKPNSNLSFKQ